MWNSDKIKKLFTFDKVVGYATIVGSIATMVGATIVNNLKVELKPMIKVMQKEQQGVKTKISQRYNYTYTQRYGCPH